MHVCVYICMQLCVYIVGIGRHMLYICMYTQTLFFCQHCGCHHCCWLLPRAREHEGAAEPESRHPSIHPSLTSAAAGPTSATPVPAGHLGDGQPQHQPLRYPGREKAGRENEAAGDLGNKQAPRFSPSGGSYSCQSVVTVFWEGPLQ